MKGDVLLQNIKISGVIPISKGKKSTESKLLIREAVLKKLGKNLENVKKRCSEKPLSLNMTFFLHKTSFGKKDLGGLSENVIKILGAEMSSKKEALKGLEIITNSNLLHRVIFEKTLIDKKDLEGFSFSIYEWE
jgi:hypothetical protein